MSFTDIETCCDGCKHLIYEKETNAEYCAIFEDPVEVKDVDEDSGANFMAWVCWKKRED